VTASGADVIISKSLYAIPRIDRQIQPEMVFKVGANPATDDGSWTVTGTGTDVTFMSNIGGARYNLIAGTEFIFDPPVSGIESVVVKTDFTGGADPNFLGGVRDIVDYELFDGPSESLDMFRGMLRGFPAVVIAWQNSQPADGSVVSTLSRRSRVSSNEMLLQELFTISIITSRAEAHHVRSLEGLIAMDDITGLLTDRMAVDGVNFSSPGGVHIVSRGREFGQQAVYKKYYIYTLSAVVTHTISKTDTRTFSLLERINMDVLRRQDPPLPNQGDYPLVNDVIIDTT
jgi:hypothetical protein